MFRNLPRFEFMSPKTTEDCIAVLAQYGEKARLIAGGTDMIPQMKRREIKPEYVISMNQIPDIGKIQFSKTTGLKIGTLTKIAEIAQSDIIKEYYPILSQAASVLGSMEIRNRGTVGGNLCNASPAADMAPPLLVLDTKAVVASKKGERIIPLEDFFVGPGKTVLTSGEILLRLEVPPMKSNSAGEYVKIGIRKAMDIAVVGVAALIMPGLKNNNICKEARLCLGAVAPTPIRAREAESVLTGKKLSNEIIELAAETASKEASPIKDIRASEGYRREMVRILTRRAIKEALHKINS